LGERMNTMITCGGGAGVSGLLMALATSRHDHRVLVGQIEGRLTLGAARAAEVVGIPRADDPEYVEQMLELCRAYEVDLLIPVYDGELEALAAARDRFAAGGTAVLVGDVSTVGLCVDKAALMTRLAGFELPIPRSRRVHTVDELITAAARLGYPETTLCIKPTRAMGGRGFHVIRDEYDRFAQMFLTKPERIDCTLEEVCAALERAPAGRADLLLAEYAPGEQFSVDAVARRGELLAAVACRKTGEAVLGMSLGVQIGNHPEAETVVEQVVELLELDGPLNVDLRRSAGGRLLVLEVNPRVSAHAGFTCRRLHLMDLAIDALAGDLQPMRTYLRSGERLVGLRYYGDLAVSASEAGRLLQGAAAQRPVAAGL
jgi:carbamoyl-phosphate synthase large subunit